MIPRTRQQQQQQQQIMSTTRSSSLSLRKSFSLTCFILLIVTFITTVQSFTTVISKQQQQQQQQQQKQRYVVNRIGQRTASSSSSSSSSSTSFLLLSTSEKSSSSSGDDGSGGVVTSLLDGKEIRQPITPLGNFILVKLKDTLQATSGGILLPDQSKERPTEGIVIESGPGKYHPFTAVPITNPIHKGMSVVFGKYDGIQVEYNGDECQMIRDDNVLLAYNGVSMRLDDVIPIRDYVLVELDDESNSQDTDTPGVTTRSGVVLASSVLKDLQPCQGTVIKIGPGRMASNGEYTPSPVAVGDKIKFKDYAGNELTIENKLYSVVKMVDILCTYNDTE